MASDTCDGCGADVPIGGGISGLWRSAQSGTGGMILELSDGTEHFLCFACIDRLPEEPSAADVRALEPAGPNGRVGPVDTDDVDGADDVDDGAGGHGTAPGGEDTADDT